MTFLNDVTRIGLALVLAAVALFIIPIMLLDHCYYTTAMIVTSLSPFVLLGIAFHPSVLLLIGAVDVLAYFSASSEDRSARFSGTIIRQYMRYVTLAICISTTSLMRQMLTMLSFDTDFSFVGLVLPFYLILIRKHFFGGDLELYLSRYVHGSLLICAVGFGFGAFFVPSYFDPSLGCQIRQAQRAARSRPTTSADRSVRAAMDALPPQVGRGHCPIVAKHL